MKLKFYFLFIFSISVFAQKIETSIDTLKNKVGAPFTLTLKTKVSPNSTVLFPETTHFGELEILESYPIDTLKKDTYYQLIKKYALTQFDSGKYVIPPVVVLINKKPILSDSIMVVVNNVKVDTLKQKMYDIKPIILVKKPLGNWWIYLLIVVVLAITIYLGYQYWKKNKTNTIAPIIYNSPIEKAVALLEIIQKKQLLQKGEVKEYYSQITDITRDYIEDTIKIPAKESTTAELIMALRLANKKGTLKLSNTILQNLEQVLKQADLVKFAQSKPLEHQIQADTKTIQNTIDTINKAIPTVTYNLTKQDQVALQIQEKKQKYKQKIIIVSAVVALLCLVTTYLLLVKGLDYIKNGFTGYATKELLQTTWIKSEYGDPGVIIETPEVLKRVAAKKETQFFEFGSLSANFHTAVGTSKLQEQDSTSANTCINNTIQLLQNKGCQNIIDKQLQFTTPQGLKGVKTYGTLSYQKKQMYYEIVVFAQSKALQQILIVYKENDQNAKKITERILNSVQLKLED